MNYYKVLRDGIIVDANYVFLRWSEKHKILLGCDPEDGQFIQSSDQTSIWRTDWLNPAPDAVAVLYELVDAVEIKKEEYDTLRSILDSGKTPEEPEPDQEPVDEPSPSHDLDYLKEKKISALNKACNEQIVAGFSIPLSDGETYRFTMKDEDQIALMLLISRAQAGETDLDFYAADRKCLVLSTEDALTLGNYAIGFRSYHVAYYRCLADWVDAMLTAEDVASVQYGAIVPADHRSTFLIKYATALGVKPYAAAQ